MRRVTRSIDVRRDAATAWRLVGDPSRYEDVLVGVTRWQHLGGDRYAVLMQVGAVATGGQVVVTVDDDQRRIRWETVRGTGHTATLQVTATGPDRSRLTFELVFDLVGLAAPLTEWLAAPMVERNLVASLETARHLLEHVPEVLDEAGDAP